MMVYLYYKYKDRRRAVKPERLNHTLPIVTIQLPLYNEQYVAQRLIEAVTKIQYPRELLEIQVLDDSNDKTQKIAREAVAYYHKLGFDIHYLSRDERLGYKAGALQEGLNLAKGEYVAIFDADFVPPPDFLRKTIPFFKNDNIALVQTRWAYLNRTYSILTEIQAIMLDGHFVMEHGARYGSGRFFNFNGTGGVWRKQSIEAAGGWEHDTLTEDLDLSYRAQLLGQNFIFLEDVTTPSELPIEMNAFKTQQHRWAKGSIQTAKKILPLIWRSQQPFRNKLEASYHVTNNVAYLLMLFLSVLIFPSIVIRVQAGWINSFWIDLPFLCAATISVSLFYLLAQIEINRGKWWHCVLRLPLLMSIGIGICINNSRAVLEAMLNLKSSFQRTPKYGINNKKDTLEILQYRGIRNWLPVLELLFSLHFGLLIYYSATNEIYSSLPFLFLFFIGYLYVGLTSLWPQTIRRG